jgi:hypothetical protein
MHKKEEEQLISLAKRILDLEHKKNIAELQKEARKIYEQLTVLKYLDKNIVQKNKENKAQPEDSAETASVTFDLPKANVKDDTLIEKSKPMLTEQEVESIFGQENTMQKNEAKELPSVQFTLEDELKDAISADLATQLFEKATKDSPTVNTSTSNKPRSLNDALLANNLQVGLNDRIAFVKHLFDGSQEDFNRVLSQLNSFKTEEEAKYFIYNIVKPDYNWVEKEEYEQRLMAIIGRKFL